MLFSKPIDNSKLVVPYYTELTPESIYPCNTEYLKYDKDTHRYYLTEAGIANYGIEYEGNTPQKLIRTATDHIYSYISLMAQTRYNLMCYRIAKSYFGSMKSYKEGRLEFEQMLAKQAEFIAEFGDAKKTPKLVVNPETGRVKEQDLDMSGGYWLHDDVIGFLNSNYLTDPNAVYNPHTLDWSQY